MVCHRCWALINAEAVGQEREGTYIKPSATMGESTDLLLDSSYADAEWKMLCKRRVEEGNWPFAMCKSVEERKVYVDSKPESDTIIPARTAVPFFSSWPRHGKRPSSGMGWGSSMRSE